VKKLEVVLLLGFLVSGQCYFPEKVLPKTRASNAGWSAMWYVRPTHATVATTYVLKVQASGMADEVDTLTIRTPENNGLGDLPSLRLDGDVLYVEFDDANILYFQNKQAILRGTRSEWLTVVLVDREQ
jgi:hypothetical protein